MEQPNQSANPGGGPQSADPSAGQGAPEAGRNDANAAPTQSAQQDVPGSTVEALQVQLQAARDAADENLRGWQRSQADFVNYRRRVEAERSDLVKLAESGLVLDFLPVVDDLERALAGVPPELAGLTWADGIALIGRKLQMILEAHGVKGIEALGREFDPHEHEAVMREGDPDEATVVTGELQRGYRMYDRVIRPALVKVGSPPAQGTGEANGS